MKCAGCIVFALTFVGLYPAEAKERKEDRPSAKSTAQENVSRQAAVLAGGSLRLRQRALRRLGAIPGSEAERVLMQQLDEMDGGRLPLGLWLDLLEAAAQRQNPAIQARLAERERQVSTATDRMKPWQECLEGGDANEGRVIFRERPEAGCIRCHRAQGEGGSIGPDLRALHQRAERIAILESIVEPNNAIVPGFQQLLLKLKDGKEVSGILSFEGPDMLRLTSVIDGKPQTVRTVDLESESALPSAMPPGFGTILGKRAIRDLVEYLAMKE